MDPESNGDRTVSALRSKAPGEDHEDPYDDVNISTLPGWWQKAIEEFEEHGLRPYRPPRFEDGVLKHEVIEDLEARHDVDITFIGFDSRFGDNWEIQIDETSIGEIGRHRSPDGYTVYETDSDEFVEQVESNL